MIPFERTFQLDTTIICNARFVDDESQPLKAAALNKLQAAIKEGRQATTNVADALLSSGIPFNPANSQKIKLFWYHLSRYYFWSAFLTVWESGKQLISSLKDLLMRNELFNHPELEAEIINVDSRLSESRGVMPSESRASTHETKGSFGKPLDFFKSAALEIKCPAQETRAAPAI